MFSLRWAVLISTVCYFGTVPIAAATLLPGRFLKQLRTERSRNPHLYKYIQHFRHFSTKNRGNRSI